MEVPGEGGCNRGWGDEGKAFTLQNVPLAGYKRQGLLNCVGNRLASPRGDWGADVVHVRTENYAATRKVAQGDLENYDEKETGEGTSLLDSMGGGKNFIRGGPDKSGSVLECQGNYAQQLERSTQSV